VDGPERDRLMAGALATLMLGGWPEPFGLVAVESMATGTPVIARRAGGYTETVEHGVNGFLVDDVEEARLAVERIRDLSRVRVRTLARERFSGDRMTLEYEAAFRQVLASRGAPTAGSKSVESEASPEAGATRVDPDATTAGVPPMTVPGPSSRTRPTP
jgi:hypothetical protein